PGRCRWTTASVIGGGEFARPRATNGREPLLLPRAESAAPGTRVGRFRRRAVRGFCAVTMVSQAWGPSANDQVLDGYSKASNRPAGSPGAQRIRWHPATLLGLGRMPAGARKLSVTVR